jgi:hypothetical protein
MKNMISNIYKGFFSIYLDMKNYDFETYTKGFSHGKNGPNLPDFKEFLIFFLNCHF